MRRVGKGWFGVAGVAAWAYEDGARLALPAGARAICRGPGSRLADKALEVPSCARPGDVPRDYPRKRGMALDPAAA